MCAEPARPLPAHSTPWDKESTLSRNYKALGLARDPNEAHGRLNSVKRAAAAEEDAEDVCVVLRCAVRTTCAEALARRAQAEPTLGEQAQTDEEGLRVALGQHLPRGQRPPRQLTATQLVRPVRYCCLLAAACAHGSSRRTPQRVVGALVEAHGDDIAAMARDIKRNSMQHTAGVRAGPCAAAVRRILMPPCADAARLGCGVSRAPLRGSPRVPRAQETSMIAA